jgi:2-hydroxycyclohexanecarboxyl-CoA dehydrogenase
MERFRLEGRRVVVTGGAQGIGRAVAAACVEAGAAHVLVADLDGRLAAETATDLGPAAASVALDVTDAAAVRSAVEGAPGVDVLVCAAGVIGGMQPFADTQPKDWEREVRVCYFGVLNTVHAALGLMREQGYGRIVTIASDGAKAGEPHAAVYAGAKAAVIAFTKSVAREEGRHGITANAVCPGTTRTALVERAGLTEEDLARATRFYAVPRLGEPDDIAAGVLYLASDAASWVTGQALSVSGGYTMQ